MKNGLIVLAVLIAVTIAGGVLTSGFGFQIPIERQTADPSASVFDATPDQANMLILMIGFILFNVLGAGVTIMALFWLGNREVIRAGATPNQSGNSTTLPEKAS